MTDNNRVYFIKHNILVLQIILINFYVLKLTLIYIHKKKSKNINTCEAHKIFL